MREAMGSSMLLYIVIVIVSAVMLLFVSIISYAKAYGAKNKVISAIETFNGYTTDAKKEIENNLGKIGYTITSKDFCSGARVKKHLEDLGIPNAPNLYKEENGKYGYCIYEMPEMDGKSYVVVTFVNFYVPIVGETLAFPVYGQTKVIGRTWDF